MKKKRVSRTRCVPGSGGTEAGVRSPHQGKCLGQRWSIWRCFGVKQLICDSLNGMRVTQTVLAAAIHILERGASPLESTATWNWSIEVGEQFQGKVCYCRRQPKGTWERRSIVVGNACEGKPGKHGGRVILLSHTGSGDIFTASLSTHIGTGQRKDPSKDGPKSAWCAEQLRRTPSRVPL